MTRFTPKGKMTKAQREWIELVSQQRCVVTGRNDIQIHHLVECGRRLGHEWILPLSVETHKNINSVPFNLQLEMCRDLYKKLGREFPEPQSKLDYLKRIK